MQLNPPHLEKSHWGSAKVQQHGPNPGKANVLVLASLLPSKRYHFTFNTDTLEQRNWKGEVVSLQ